MTRSIRIVVNAEHIAAADALALNDLSRPVADALAEVTGQDVDVSGSEPYGTWIATLGDGDWVLVVELPADANRWLNARWEHEAAGPFEFELEVPAWIRQLVGQSEWVTLAEASRELRTISPNGLRTAAQNRRNGTASDRALAARLGMRRFGRDWLVPREALDAEVYLRKAGAS